MTEQLQVVMYRTGGGLFCDVGCLHDAGSSNMLSLDMATEPQEDRPIHPWSQGARYVAAPKDVIQLLDLREIEALWGFSESKVYAAAARGQLRAYGRPGRQKCYSEAELIAAFGTPPNSPKRPSGTEKSDRGGYHQYEQLRLDPAA